MVQRQLQALPHALDRLQKIVAHLHGVHRPGRDAQTLATSRHRGVVDGLHVVVVVPQEHVARLLAQVAVHDQQGHNMGVARQHREPVLSEHLLHVLVRLSELAALLDALRAGQLAHALGRSGRHCRGQRRREDEARGVASDGVEYRVVASNVPAEAADGLPQRALDDVDVLRNAQLLRHAGAAVAVHAHSVHLVQVRQGTVFLGGLDDLDNGSNRSRHAVDGLKGNDEGRRRVVQSRGLQQLAQVRHVVVAEDALRGALGVEHAADHAGVVLLVAKKDRMWEDMGESAERRFIGDVPRRENQRRLLIVPLRERRLQLTHGARVASNVARATRPGTELVDGGLGSRNDAGVLPLRKVVIGTPNGDLLGGVVLGVIPVRLWVAPDHTLDLLKDAVPTFVLDLLHGLLKDLRVGRLGGDSFGVERRRGGVCCGGARKLPCCVVQEGAFCGLAGGDVGDSLGDVLYLWVLPHRLEDLHALLNGIVRRHYFFKSVKRGKKEVSQ
eukprot:PhM_4_TR14018/c0_g1_i1/m.64214